MLYIKKKLKKHAYVEKKTDNPCERFASKSERNASNNRKYYRGLSEWKNKKYTKIR